MNQYCKIVVATLMGLVLAAPVSACPSCKEAIANSSAEDQNENLPATYNQSIYLMVSVPYLSLALVGCLIYRGCQRNEAYRQAQLAARQAAETSKT